MGLNAGATYDLNAMEELASRYNLAMEYYSANNAGTETDQITVPHAPVFGLNVRYQFNFFFFRIGYHYTAPFQSMDGSITPAGGTRNKIKMDVFQASVPTTIGLLVPMGSRSYFFIGCGPSLHHTSITITQSNPVQTSPDFSFASIDRSLSSNKRDSYTGAFVGYHLMIGAEIPVHDKFTVSVEWIHQQGNSHQIENDGIGADDAELKTPKKSINVMGDFVLFGINYYIVF
ncbi:MAG: outer membrane beta-barrel protein [Spirochaetes bacterium]|nr:outer membrane beta-barrel protein [Spirochaetota bacterium]